jgi:hypothetical protein
LEVLFWASLSRTPHSISHDCQRHRGTSLIRNRPPLGPYSRSISGALLWSKGGVGSYERGTPIGGLSLYSLALGCVMQATLFSLFCKAGRGQAAFASSSLAGLSHRSPGMHVHIPKNQNGFPAFALSHAQQLARHSSVLLPFLKPIRPAKACRTSFVGCFGSESPSRAPSPGPGPACRTPVKSPPSAPRHTTRPPCVISHKIFASRALACASLFPWGDVQQCQGQ